MTREQALEIIKRESDLYPEDSVDSVEWLEVYKALEQQSEDCVSRAELMKLYYESRPTLATNVYEFGEKLQALPPVTPTRKVGISDK